MAKLIINGVTIVTPQIVDKTAKISMDILMFWSFFKKISHMAEYQ